MAQSFGQVIQVTGTGNGFPGNFSRTVDTIVVAWPVSSATNLPFGSGAVLIANASGGGGNFVSLADYLATASHAATLEQYFAGVAIRNVKVLQPYSGYAQNANTQVSTTMTQVTPGSTTIVVVSATGLVVGQSVEGAGIAAGTLVTGISGTTITISLATLAAIPALTNVTFTNVTAPSVGYFANGLIGEVLVRSSVSVAIPYGTPALEGPVYIRTVANAALPGTAVGDFEASADANTTPTISITAATTTLTTSTGTGVAVGQQLVAPGIRDNTYIVSGSSTTWTISQPALSTLSTAAASFNNCALLGSVADPWIRFRTGTLDSNDIAEIVIPSRHAA